MFHRVVSASWRGIDVRGLAGWPMNLDKLHRRRLGKSEVGDWRVLRAVRVAVDDGAPLVASADPEADPGSVERRAAGAAGQSETHPAVVACPKVPRHQQSLRGLGPDGKVGEEQVEPSVAVDVAAGDVARVDLVRGVHQKGHVIQRTVASVEQQSVFFVTTVRVAGAVQPARCASDVDLHRGIRLGGGVVDVVAPELPLVILHRVAALVAVGDEEVGVAVVVRVE